MKTWIPNVVSYSTDVVIILSIRFDGCSATSLDAEEAVSYSDVGCLVGSGVVSIMVTAKKEKAVNAAAAAAE